MYTVCVGTQGRSCYEDGFNVDIVAVVEPEVELGTVLYPEVFDSQVRAHEEPDCLQNGIF